MRKPSILDLCLYKNMLHLSCTNTRPEQLKIKHNRVLVQVWRSHARLDKLRRLAMIAIRLRSFYLQMQRCLNVRRMGWDSQVYQGHCPQLSSPTLHTILTVPLMHRSGGLLLANSTISNWVGRRTTLTAQPPTAFLPSPRTTVTNGINGCITQHAKVNASANRSHGYRWEFPQLPSLNSTNVPYFRGPLWGGKWATVPAEMALMESSCDRWYAFS